MGYLAAFFSLGFLFLTAVVAFFSSAFGMNWVADVVTAALLGISIGLALLASRTKGVAAGLGVLMMAGGVLLGGLLFTGWSLGIWHRYDIERWCAANGVLSSVEPVKSRSIRFTPNKCSYDFGHKLCSAAEYPGISAPVLLARGFQFVEYDTERASWREEPEGRTLRLRLTNRPDERCEWFDRHINREKDLAIIALESKGIERSKCILAEFDDRTEAEYRFVMVTTKELEGRRRAFHQASLVESPTSRIVAGVATVTQGGTEKRAGLWCGNYGEFEKLLNLVTPLR